MNTTLMVKHTVSHKDEPLAVLANLPGNLCESSPAQMRRLAVALMNAADDCELLVKDSRRYGPIRREYSLREGIQS